MREIVFDTETTGFGVEEHRIIEIGAVEIVNRLPTGKVFHTYLNPQRDIDFGATKVHGITNDKVAKSPRFADIVHDMLAFFTDAPLVAHNAEFDYSFMNMELHRCALPPLANPMVDTLVLARKKLPGQRHNLDALCRFYGIDLSSRQYHGALLDAQLLADVYVELQGGLQSSFGLDITTASTAVAMAPEITRFTTAPTPTIAATADEIARHREFLQKHVPASRWLTT